MRTFLLLLAVNCCFPTGTFGQLQQLTIPRGEFFEGNAAGSRPFLVIGATNSARFQQVYSASAFDQLLPQGGWITGISFRADTTVEALAEIPDIQINLSTTLMPVDGLSPVFAENVGQNDQVVYGRGALRLYLGISGGVPQPMSAPIALSPFFYYPGSGNLLLDVRTFAGYPPPPPPTFGTPFMDGENTLGDFVSAVGAGSVDALSGATGTFGYITRFEVIPVPEPSSLAIIGIGVLALGYTALRRNRNRNSKSRTR